MNRRSFLNRTGAVLPACCLGGRTAAESAPAARTEVRRRAADRFELVFAEARPGAIRILQLTDTHFGNPDPAKRLTDARTWKELPELVRSVAPDCLIHTGDFIDNDVEGATAEAFEAMHALGVPWALAPGNHDAGTATTLTPDQYRERMAAGTGLMGVVERDGRRETACRIDIVTAAARSGASPTASLMVFDSGSREGSKNVTPGQLAWFEEQMELDRSRGATGPVYAMIHIPVVQFEKLRESGRYEGRFGEKVCFETDAGSTFDALKRSGRVKAVFSGHDHENTFYGAWEGIELVYGRVGGWSAYGEGQRGGRLIELDWDTGRHRHRIVLPDAG
jgi:hypothetical protein